MINLLFFQVAVSKVWAFLAAIFIIVAPFVNEIYDIHKAFINNRRVHPDKRRDTKTNAHTSRTNVEEVKTETSAAHIEESNEISKVDDNVTVENVCLSGVEK